MTPSGVRRDGLLLRAMAAFIAMPGMVAYLVPLLLAPGRNERALWRWSGLLLVAAGTVLLVWCAREFYVSGKGTLAPWSPPRTLVTTGPYGRSRNPMYVAVSLVLFGWAMWFASTTLLIYALAVVAAFILRVIFYEEPLQAAAFGETWAGYRQRVRRWL